MFSLTCHPHSTGFSLFPFHCCPVRYVRKECCLAAALVGGRDSNLNEDDSEELRIHGTVVACVTVFVGCLNCTSTTKLEKEFLSSTSNVLFGSSMSFKHLKDIETIRLSKQKGLFLSMTEKSRRTCSIAASDGIQCTMSLNMSL